MCVGVDPVDEPFEARVVVLALDPPLRLQVVVALDAHTGQYHTHHGHVAHARVTGGPPAQPTKELQAVEGRMKLLHFL